jgi:integrase
MVQVADLVVEKEPRRANGDGSIFFWKGRGWYAAVTGPDGRRVMRKAPKQTERGAEALLRKLMKERDEGALTRRSMTLEQFVEEWLLDAKRRNVKQSTIASYREKIETYVLPTLGKKRLDRITVADIDRLYDAKVEAGLSATTVGMIHVRLHNLLKLAKRRQLVGQVVTEQVTRPRIEKYDARTLTVEEARLLLKGIANHRYGPFWIFILGTGCRYGEAAGLRWQDVDLDHGVAHIRQIVSRRRGAGGPRNIIEDGAKSEAGKRDIPLPHWVVDALRAQSDQVDVLRVIASRRWTERGLVFPNSIGGPLDESPVNIAWHQVLRSLKLEGAGKKPLRMHDLRHSKGTLMADEGEDLIVIQRTLGHARASTTADLYVGRVPKALRSAADRYGDLLVPPQTGATQADEAVS